MEAQHVEVRLDPHRQAARRQRGKAMNRTTFRVICALILLPVMLMAGAGSILGFAVFGMAFSKRRRGLFGLIAVFALVLVIAIGCGELPGAGDAAPQPGEGETGTTVPDIQGGTTYYWKIVADDGNGGQTSSDVWSFTTISQ